MGVRSLLIAIQMLASRAGRTGSQAGLAVGFLLLASPHSVLAHGGELELSVSPPYVAAGDEVTVAGEGFVANAPLELHLTGPNGDAHFGNLAADEEGSFTNAVRVPSDVTPGIYLLRAAGADREASAELTVGAMAGMAQTTQEARSVRERPSAWRPVALLLFLGLGIVGLALARPDRRDVLARPAA